MGLAIAFWLLLMGAVVAIDPTSFTVCWWNLENFGVTDRYVEGHHVLAAMKPESEQRSVAAILHQLNPDILGVAEVLQDPADRYVKLLRELLRTNGLDYPYLTTARGQDPRIQMVVFSRFPLAPAHFTGDVFPVTLVSATGETLATNYRVNRGFLNVDIQITPRFNLHVMTAHLKSKRTEPGVASDVAGEPGDAYVRRQEAVLLRKHMDDYLRGHPQGHLLVMGDFNDTMGSRALVAIGGLRGDQSPMRDLPLVDDLGDWWTHFFVPEYVYARIDYMFVNEALWRDFLPGKSFLYRWHQGESAVLNQGSASDHRPLFATFRTEE
jgi:endonuclease/exonuclease/phosphatase family metal-dependent hydrolase